MKKYNLVWWYGSEGLHIKFSKMVFALVVALKQKPKKPNEFWKMHLKSKIDKPKWAPGTTPGAFSFAKGR